MIRALYIKSDSRLLNPTLDEDLIAGYYADDPESARSEWGGEFRSDLSQYMPDEFLERSIMHDRKSLLREQRYHYCAFVDCSGGAHDRMVLAISHKEENSHCVLDKLEIVEPDFNFYEVVERFAVIMSAYGTRMATGDYYGAELVPQAFAQHGVVYQPSELTKSQIFAEALHLFSADFVELLDVRSLHSEFRALEVRPRSGRAGDLIEVPRNGYDDQANAVCGSLLLAANQLSRSRDEYANNVTQARCDYDPLVGLAPIRTAPRHPHLLPPNLQGGTYDDDFSRANRDYDPLNR